MRANYRIAFCFSSFFLLASCISKKQNSQKQLATVVSIPRFELHYAKGFSLQYYGDSAVCVKTYYPQTHELLDSFVLQKNGKGKLRWPLQSVGIQSTTYFSYLEALGKLSCIDAVCGVNFYRVEERNKLKPNCSDVCDNSQFNLEKLALKNIDALFMYPFENSSRQRYEKLGISTLFVTEYLESSALARLEWLKFFGILTNQPNASILFEQMEQSYLVLKQTSTTASVAFNLPFNENWDMPSGVSISAGLVKDAGLEYVLRSQHPEGNIVLPREAAYSLLSKTDYWVIVADRPAGFSMNDLVMENPIYKTFPSVRNGKVIFCNTRTTPYFSQGLIEPAVLLQDLLVCQGKIKKTTTKYFRLLK